MHVFNHNFRIRWRCPHVGRSTQGTPCSATGHVLDGRSERSSCIRDYPGDVVLPWRPRRRGECDIPYHRDLHASDWLRQSRYRHGIRLTRCLYRSNLGQYCICFQTDLGVGPRWRSASLVLAHQQSTPSPRPLDLGTHCDGNVFGLSQHWQLCSVWCVHLPGIVGAVYVVCHRHQLHAPCQIDGRRTTSQLVPRSIRNPDQYLRAVVHRMDDGDFLFSSIPSSHGR